ncbi:MAG: YeeE/YedE thiosulfate transporter family protein [Isosphaeraceae bacterium]
MSLTTATHPSIPAPVEPSTGPLVVRPGGYANPYLCGACLGVLLFLANVLTGHGLGASGGMARVVAVAADAVVPRAVERHGVLVTLARPARVTLDNWVVWSILGSILGAAVSAALAGRFRPEIHRGPQVSVRLRLLTALIGGAFMGYGAQWARGCTSGQALSGGAVLSAGSWALMFAIFGSAYALAYPLRRLWR